MREIKFRAWDKQYKTMSAVTMLLLDIKELDCIGNNGEPKSIEHFELMQFTGMCDKNGIEIYEGDIVMLRNIKNKYSKQKFIVEFHHASFQLALPGGKRGHNGDYSANKIAFITILVQINANEACFDIDNFESYFDVIGNIYENPELLREEKNV